MTVPTGSPIWTRSAGIADYGGNADLRNYQSQGAIDARTDVTAEEFQRLTADMSAGARVATFAELVVTCEDAPPAAPTIEYCAMATGDVTTTPYVGDSAPAGFPSAARNGDGDFTITFASSYNDAYGVAAAPDIAHVDVSVEGSTAANYTWEVSGLTVRIRVFNTAGAALPSRTVSVAVS